MNNAHRAQTALQNKNYAEAIALFTSALEGSQSPLWLIQRSTAYQRNQQHELALADADNAVRAARSRGKRELIATAQLRRAIALNALGRYGDARLCFLWTTKYNEKEKGTTLWMGKNTQDYDRAGGDEAECNQITVKEIPDEVQEVASTKEKKLPEKKKDDKGKGIAGHAAVVPTYTSKEKIRHEWYQSTNTVTIEIFAKSIPKENAEVDIGETSLDISFPVGDSGSYDFTASPLFAKIVKDQSNFRITPNKMEITLTKALPGLKWSSLEGSEPIAPATAASEPDKIAPITKAPSDTKAPAYPTSSKNGPKNWDTVITDEADEKEGEGEIEDFFKKLYKDADPDTRRAMMKSYQESGGTSLSTNWADVGSKTMEINPPDGMEAKKWES